MVLGVSEAGVALLDAPAHSPADASEPGHGGRLDLEVPQPSDPASADDLAAEGMPGEAKPEASLLSRLFRRKAREAEGLEPGDFQQLFSESLEDEDLRRKLAMGQSGRVA